MSALAESAWLAPLSAAVAAAALAGWILIRPWAEGVHRVIAAVLVLTAVAAGSDALLLLSPDSALLWRRVGLSAEAIRMAALVLLGSTLIGRSAAEADPRAQRRTLVAAVAAGVCLALVWWGGLGAARAGEAGAVVPLGPLGGLAYAVLLLGLVLALAQLEAVLRASREPFRFRVKFVLFGAGALAGFQAYVSAQTLLIGAWRSHHAVVGGAVSLVSVGLVAFGLGRRRLTRTLDRVSVSPQMLYGSLTLLGAGLYLLGVGLVGELVRLSGRSFSVGAAELAVFLLTVALVVGVSSRAARARFRLFVSRHLLRSRYDYRMEWLKVTDAFRSAEYVEETLDRLLDLLAHTFGAPRLSVWMPYEADDRFHQVRSTNVEPPPPPLARDHPVIESLARSDEPLEPPVAEAAGAFLEATRAVLMVPIRGAGELLGFIALSAGPAGAAYDEDDRDLLRAIAHHVGVLLAHARLAEERQAAAEIDALNRFAAFYLHDLKNLSARLSLVAQNAAKHGNDPEFRASAMKAVSRTAQEMGELLGRLSRRSPALGRVEPVDVAELVEQMVRSLGPGFETERRSSQGTIPPVLAAPEQLQQVLLNLLLNARRAVDSSGAGAQAASVRVRIEGEGGQVRVEVADDGPGIPPERLRSLFRPFQSTSPGGYGIGLYESKRIVESYGGRLRVESGPGRGTRVLLELPAVALDAGVGQTSTAVKEH